MSGLLEDYRRKRGRANKHLQEIERAVHAYAEADDIIVGGKFHDSLGKHVFEVPLRKPNPEMALMIGDCVYDLRASLDYLVTAWVRAAGNAESSSTEFPIYSVPMTRPVHDVEEARARWSTDPDGLLARKLHGTPPETKTLLERLQPFFGAPALDPSNHPLALLKALSNRDKHRRLNLIGIRVGVTFTDPDGNPLFDQPSPHGSMNVSESRIGDVQMILLGGLQKEREGVHVKASQDVAFDEDDPIYTGSVVETLKEICRYIDNDVALTSALIVGSR